MARHGRLRQTGAAASLAKGLAMLLGTALVSVLVFGAIVYTNLRSGVETFETVSYTHLTLPTTPYV